MTCIPTLREAVDHFVDVQGKPQEDVAKRIAADGIDILVDLGGHTTSAGLPVLAYRPAPVQVSGLGYMYPTGLSTVDWFLTDAQADGEQQLADWMPFHEQPLFLTSQFCYTGRSDLAPSAGAPCARNGFVTFGVFGRWQKVTDEMGRDSHGRAREPPARQGNVLSYAGGKACGSGTA